MPAQYKSAIVKEDNIRVGTGYLARPNGHSLGSIEVRTSTGTVWIEGYGVRIVGLEIKWLTL